MEIKRAEQEERWHALAPEAAAGFLRSDTTHGLSSPEATARLTEHGPNIAAKEETTSALTILLRQFKSFIIYVLGAAAILSGIIGEHVEFIVISCIVAFIVLLSFFEEYKATKDMEALKRLTPRQAKALRDGQLRDILAAQLVPGDVILLTRGDIVPADARIIEESGLQADESALTGESMPIKKRADASPMETPLAERKSMLYAGAQVMNGHAKAIVVATGRTTELGKIASMVKDAGEESSPLQKRLDRLSKQFSYAVFAACALIFIVGITRGEPWEHLLLLVVAVAVAGIPESLPAVIGVALAIGVKRMAKENAIIKRLPAVETLGACTVICTDKTGTLTQNKMVIERIWAFDTEVNVTGNGFAPEGLFLREKERVNPLRHAGLAKVLEIGAFCNNASLRRDDRKNGVGRGNEEWLIDGESTEGALVVLARKAGLDNEALHRRYPRLHEHPFDTERKCMSSIHLVKERPIVYAKGAPERILERSTHYFADGKVRPLDQEARRRVLAKNEEYATKGLRVLALAYKEHRGETYELHRIESGLVLVGLVSIRDPPGPSAAESVKLCQGAGINVVMITGDNALTARAIASELGILRGDDKVLTGDELDGLSDDAFANIVDDVAVYARVTSKHKLRVVRVLQSRGHIVAMTGDGVNDAPALKKADIGVAMGKRGTEVAKEASEMVIKDDNFATIVTAVKEGRTIYANIRKFVYYLLAGNFSEVILILIAALLGVIPPLTPLMILFINLVTSDIPAIGLCKERPSANIMRQPPRDPKEGVLSDYLLLKISQVVPIIVLGTIALYIWELNVKGSDIVTAQTMAFVTLIMFVLFHVFNAKSFDETIFTRRTFTNWTLFLGYVLSVGGTLLVLYWEPLRKVFGTTPLDIGQWISIIIVASVVLLFVEVQKSILSAEMKERAKMSLYPTRR